MNKNINIRLSEETFIRLQKLVEQKQNENKYGKVNMSTIVRAIIEEYIDG